MKNLFKPTLLVILMTFTLATTTQAFSTVPVKIKPIERTSEAESQKMINRLNEIKAMEPSSLTRRQKRELRKEVKTIERNLHTNSSGVYISVGAAIIIVLLLILLF
jgi:predicted PurR-regulated permease PerM